MEEDRGRGERWDRGSGERWDRGRGEMEGERERWSERETWKGRGERWSEGRHGRGEGRDGGEMEERGRGCIIYTQ